MVRSEAGIGNTERRGKCPHKKEDLCGGMDRLVNPNVNNGWKELKNDEEEH